MLPLLLAAVLASLACCSSPCHGRYGEWVSEPGVFTREDQPKHLQGLHVACVWRDASGEPLRLEAYKNAVNEGEPMRAALPLTADRSWRDFRRELKAALGFRRKTNDWGFLMLKQPFGIFDEYGRRLASPREAEEASLIFVVEGGQWYWPPMRKGFVRKLHGTNLSLETLSVQPVIFRIEGFLRDHECEEIVELGRGRMHNSPVSLMDKDKGKESKEFRTSTQARLDRTESLMLREIDERISRLTKVPAPHNEQVQILRYEKTQYYAAHLDNWDPAFYTTEGSEFIEHGHNNRLITVFWYLTDVSEGGETNFPRTDGLPQPADMYNCVQGLKVKPVKGSVIFWYSLHPNGNNDPNGLHASCPVRVGEKWSANYWVWNKARPVMPPDEGVDELDDDERAEFMGKASDKLQAGEEALAVFVNDHAAKSAYLFFLGDRPGVDRFMVEIKPGARTSMWTSPGHVWLLRAEQDPSSKTLDRFVVTDDRRQEFVLRAQTRDEI